ncbi:MAG: nucleotidyltransferase domain-containing protein, partial [Bacteroidota bacterium]
MMTIDFLRQEGHILLECISGSQAYGLQIPGSDIDLKGVFAMPAPALLGLKNIPQISENQN